MKLTIKHALQVQAKQLADWKLLLNDTAYWLLEKRIKELTHGVTEPCNIPRGTMIYETVMNHVLETCKEFKALNQNFNIQ